MKTSETIELPLDLEARILFLKEELEKAELALMKKTLIPALKEKLVEAGMNSVVSVTWGFHPESDDEGGSAWYVDYISYLDSEESSVELEDDEQMEELNDDMYDLLNSYSKELNEYEIEGIDLKGERFL